VLLGGVWKLLAGADRGLPHFSEDSVSSSQLYITSTDVAASAMAMFQTTTPTCAEFRNPLSCCSSSVESLLYACIVARGAKWLPGQVGVKARSLIALGKVVNRLQVACAHSTVRLTIPHDGIAALGFFALLLATAHIYGPLYVPQILCSMPRPAVVSPSELPLGGYKGCKGGS
jgi:hypothetical protein